MKRLAFVVGRYGLDIVGGAETLVRSFAEEWQKRGGQVEILTTCAKDHRTWQNELPAGATAINGVTVRRFPVDRRNVGQFEEIHGRIITKQPLSKDEEETWFREGVNSAELYRYIREEGEQFDYICFVPYLSSLTYFGMQIRPERSVLWPCLHNESYAYLQTVGAMFERAAGIVFNAPAEASLARCLQPLWHKPQAVVGMGFYAGARGDGDKFRQKHDLADPYLIYVGRREPGKNTPLLLDYFTRYVRQGNHPYRLLFAGSGDMPDLAPDVTKRVINLGFLDEQEKADAIAGATVLCQPSINESFSIVLFEGWNNGVPVLVHGDCAVTRDHCQASNGGLWFRTYEEFAECLDLMAEESELAATVAKQGRQYLEREYSWDAVIARLQVAWEQIGGGRHA